MSLRIEATVCSRGGRYKKSGVIPLEIRIQNESASGLPHVLHEVVSITLQTGNVIYCATIHSTTRNTYVWISATLYTSSGERTTLAEALRKADIHVNEKVLLLVDGTTISVAKQDEASRTAVGANPLLEGVGDAFADIRRASQELTNVAHTTRIALIEARIGQGQFRNDLIRYWGGCALTGCCVYAALTASHIKPWRNSSNDERLDPFNGLLLLGTLDLLFDDGLITFRDDGQIALSEAVSPDERNALSLHKEFRLRQIDQRHIKYLEWHRKNVFHGHAQRI